MALTKWAFLKVLSGLLVTKQDSSNGIAVPDFPDFPERLESIEVMGSAPADWSFHIGKAEVCNCIYCIVVGRSRLVCIFLNFGHGDDRGNIDIES